MGSGPISLIETTTGSTAVQSVTAGDASIVVGGTATAPTIETATLDVIASLHAPIASVGMNSEKIVNLANGSAASDGAAFGQIPVGLSNAIINTQSGNYTIANTDNVLTFSATATATFGSTVVAGQIVAITNVSSSSIVTVAAAGTINGLTLLGPGQSGLYLVTTGGASNVIYTIASYVTSAGQVIAYTVYAPSSASTYDANTTTLTAIDTTHLTVGPFIFPASGKVLVELTATCEGPAAAANHMVFGLLNHTGGALVGVSGLVMNSPTATAADNVQSCKFAQVISETAGSSLQLDWALLSNSATFALIAQGETSATTIGTGAPAVMKVTAL
jgi:hypothetical protein